MMFHIRDNLFARNGKIIEENPYFYVIGDKPPRREGVANIERVDLVPYVWDGLGYRESDEPVWKVEFEDVATLERYRNWLITRGRGMVSQSYIMYSLRVSIDYNLTRDRIDAILKDTAGVIKEALSKSLRVLAIDVEVVNGKPIIGYTLGDDIIITTNPKDITTLDFDVAVTYNGWEFDYKYLPMYGGSRYALDTVHGVKPLMDLFVFVDSGFKSAMGIQEEAEKLYDVAVQLGVHREYNIDAGLFMRAKKMQTRVGTATIDDVRDYLTLDVDVTYRIAKKWLPLLQALGAISGSNPMVLNQVALKASPGHVAEAFIHKFMEVEESAVIQDRRREYDYEAGDKARARAPGTFRNVGEYDFSAMYPSLYTQDGVDPINIRESQNGYPVTLIRGGTRVTKRIAFEPGGPIHRVLSTFYNARKATKALKSTYGDAPDQTVKIFANSAYGIFGKNGLGIVNEWAAAYIAQKTQTIFNDLWGRYGPIYGDTDSMYIELNGRDPNALLSEINDYLHRTYGPLMEMKLENVWDLVYIPRAKGGGPAEKTYIKIKGDEIVLKGGALKPRDLPRGLRYGPYREAVREVLLNNARKEDVVARLLQAMSLGDLFIEDSTTWRGLLYTNENKPITTLDRTRFPFIAYLAVAYGGSLEVDLNELTVNGVKIDMTQFIDVEFLPIDTTGKEKVFALLVNGKPVIARVWMALDTNLGRIVARVRNIADATRGDIERLALRTVLNSGLFSHLP